MDADDGHYISIRSQGMRCVICSVRFTPTGPTGDSPKWMRAALDYLMTRGHYGAG